MHCKHNIRIKDNRVLINQKLRDKDSGRKESGYSHIVQMTKI